MINNVEVFVLFLSSLNSSETDINLADDVMGAAMQNALIKMLCNWVLLKQLNNVLN